MHLFSAKIWCTTLCIQAGWAASTPTLRKRTPQRTSNLTGIAASTNNSTASPAPLIVHASDSTVNRPPQDSLPSPSFKTPNIISATLAGAGAISAITLTFLFIYRKCKSRGQNLAEDLTTSTDQLGVKKRRSIVKKSKIRHITHEEQKERYKSLFGVPAGYLRPKSQISMLETRPHIHSLPVIRYSEYLPDGQATVNIYSIDSFDDKTVTGGMLPFESKPMETLELVNGRERKSGVLRFDEGIAHPVHNYASNGDAKKLSIFSQQLPHLTSHLKGIKDKAMHKGQSLSQIQVFTQTVAQNSLSSQTDLMQEELVVPRSPSIVPTPPSYLKSPPCEHPELGKPPDLGLLVTERLERNVSVDRSSFRGRGDSYYWKVSPVLKSPET